MASAAATTAATGPPVGSMVGASAVAAATVRVRGAAAGRSTVRDDFVVAVATLWSPPALARVRLG
jgi:hypothetical protein